MVAYSWLVPFFPLVAYLLLLVLGRRAQEGIVAAISVIGSLASFVVSLLVMSDVVANGYTGSYPFRWLQFGDTTLTVGFEVTQLNAIMLVVVTFVSTLVLLFSKGYMHGDERFSVFYQYLNLFVFSMLGLVISPNLLQLYVFWELVGLCSFLLVGFWYFKPEAAAAAKKSFVVTRIGDVGLFIGIILLFLATGTFEYQSIFEFAKASAAAAPVEVMFGMTPQSLITLSAILIFIGAVGKSAQFPLHVWLPDAMEGPTPVSALIHAATMVAAGVYLVARTFPLFAVSEGALMVVAVIGGVTAIFAAIIGLTQNDIKRVVAYSTISQLGYMMLALGLSAYVASVFHLMTHAFFKALLFLAAGSVIHAVHTQDIREMGGLWKKMPITTWTFLFGALALSGIPPFAGFWSKDEILTAAFASGNWVLAILATLAAFFTAFYIFRVFFLTFTGEYRGNQSVHPHESGPVMTIPLVLLAIMSLVIGFVNAPFLGHAFGHFLQGDQTIGFVPDFSFGIAGVSVLVGIAGILLAYLMYGKRSIDAEKVARISGPFYTLSYRKFFIDEIYHLLIVTPFVWIGRILNFIDRWIVDGLVSLAGYTAYQSSVGLKYGQNGQIQTYGLLTSLGVLALVAVSLWMGGVIQ
ncbi:NADH-quinone oxidoreductase subunit L [Effusibacillus lacus]|uniref:NADH-quinone oxidoreductase subunit L n=1 Tax=Effusibacillus lacus TaxID=1348429 RepID=A0A292YMC1_9BACL|nr:NADH-quinone oxidoreductase subunit L [Effusibacillus lacus]TCS71813.1 NADH dehydrogenase subunit L [Effusibacillus lacus]GAX89620.1 NADH-quinone oxidoreductase subunit L [Effusibacillus lacus]